MRLTILGSSGTFPAAGRPCSGYLVDERRTRLWIDAGPGTFNGLVDRVDPGELAGVVISHVHPDHCSDLFALYHYLAYGPGGRIPIPVFVPEGAADHLTAFVAVETDGHPFLQVFEFTTVGDGSRVEAGELTLEFAITDHSVPAVAVRVHGSGKALTYTGDTGPGGGVVGLAAETGVLLCEASYQGASADKPYPHHLTAAEAGALAKRVKARRLMLTHLPPTLDPQRSVAEAEAEFGRPVEFAAPGMEVTV